MKIDPTLIPLAYTLSKNVYDEQIRQVDALKMLAANGKMNEGSAKHYIENFKYMRRGKKFTMTLNIESMDYFLSQIYKDFDQVGLAKALSSLYKHIIYIESLKKSSHMKSMWGLFNKYKQFIPLPIPVDNINDIKANIDILENYLVSSDPEKRASAQNLIRRGTCFLSYKVNGEIRFAPSRYLGYLDNRPMKYLIDIDGTETNKIISDIVKSSPSNSSSLDQLYNNYCIQLGIPISINGSFGVPRKFWQWEFQDDFTGDIELNDGFPEGRMIERLHKSRERSAKVIEIAKNNFLKKHGRLYCEICEFDFEATYGKLGKDFIEGHHTIWVMGLPNDHKTKPSEIAMLCSNCHRMVHRRRPWLTMENLKSLKIKK